MKLHGALASAPADDGNQSIGLEAGDFAWLLGSLCQYHRVPHDATLVARQFPPPHSIDGLRSAAAALGFDLERRSRRERGLDSTALPAIGFLRAPPGAQGPASVPVFIVRADGDRVLFFRAGSPVGEMSSRETMEAALHPALWHVTRKGPVPLADTTGAQRPAAGQPHCASFGFAWFAAELLRHRPVWRDVLLASLLIQLLGLAAPLFTQTIIDKVVVHRTLSTLLVIATALAAITLFSNAMSWIRQYLVIQNGNTCPQSPV